MIHVKNSLLWFGIIVLSTFSVLRAGSITSLTDRPEVKGKLTLTAGSIQIEGSANEFKLTDVLEADFNDAPFRLNFFTSVGDMARVLPPGWKAQDLGQVALSGSAIYGDGTFQISADGNDNHDNDRYYFAGRPWEGDGQWTVRIKQTLGDNSGTEAGLMLRDDFEELSPLFGVGVNRQKGLFHYRRERGTHSGWGGDFNAALPQWLRLTKSGSRIDGEVSTDGRQWAIYGQYDAQLAPNYWIGLWVNSRIPKVIGQAAIDQVTFTPGPAEPMTVPPGVLLRSGSFVAGHFDWMDAKGGAFVHAGKSFPIKPDQVAVAVWHPVTRKQIADTAGRTGILLRNGDMEEGDFQLLNGGGAQVSSVLLGLSWFWGDSARAYVLSQIKPRPAAYEIRLKDGSILFANGLGMNNGQLSIQEVSGLMIPVTPEEIAQFRAGPARVQTLIDLPWKASSSALASAGAVAPSGGDPSTVCWEGTHGEQILLAAAGTRLEFPLKDKFNALSLQVALSPDSPPQAQAALRVLADGKEIGRTRAFKAGEQPSQVRISLNNPKILTVVVEPATPGARLLLIDPVTIRWIQQ